MVMRSTYKISLLLLVVALTATIPSSIVAFTPRDAAAVQYRIDKEWAAIIWFPGNNYWMFCIPVGFWFVISAADIRIILRPGIGF